MPTSKEAKHVQTVLESFGLDSRVIELNDSTHSAEDAAKAVKCDVGQIAKSLVFRGKKSGNPYLVIASGRNRVDTSRLSELTKEPVALASPDFVKEATGFEIGGVPPVGHDPDILTLIDKDLMQYDTIWAAAGTSHAVFTISPKDLKRLINGTVASIK